MFKRLRQYRENRRRARLQVTESQWREALSGWPVAQRYRGEVLRCWQEMALRFLLRKRFVSGAGFDITDAMRLRIAMMATLPVLGLGLDWYRRFDNLVIYETAFIPDHDQYDELGLVVSQPEPLSGEAWYDGLVILSWEDIIATPDDGYAHNVVIHEMAHQLDMLHDGGNGAPPLHAGMDPRRWHDFFSEAWADLEYRDTHDMPLPVDCYGLEDPAEFFSVVTETFFEAPGVLAATWPGVFEQLMLFYRQDPRCGEVWFD